MNAMQCSDDVVVWCSVVQYGAVRCSVVQYGAAVSVLANVVVIKPSTLSLQTQLSALSDSEGGEGGDRVVTGQSRNLFLQIA